MKNVDHRVLIISVFPRILFANNFNTDNSGDGRPAQAPLYAATVPLTNAGAGGGAPGSDTLRIQNANNLVSTAVGAAAVSMEGGTTLTVDAGAILESSAAGQPAVLGVDGHAFVITITNSGTIQLAGGVVGNNVIDLGAFNQVAQTLVTNNVGGIINGHIEAPISDSRLDNSGTINGNYIGSANNDTINLNAGNMTGTITPGHQNANITLNLNGGTIGGDITLSNRALGGGGGNGVGTLNVGNLNETNYATAANIAGVQTATIANGSQFTLNAGNTLTLVAPVAAGNGNFTVNAGGQATLNGTIAGGQDFTNNGTVTFNSNNITANLTNNGTLTTTGNRTLTGTYTCPGTHNVRINVGAGTAETLSTAAQAVSLNNGAVTITQTDGANFPVGSTPFTIITQGGGGAPTIVGTTAPANTGTISYALAVVGANVQLTATRASFDDLLGNSQINSDVGKTLNSLVTTTNTDLSTVIAALDTLPASELSGAIEQLAANTDNRFFTATSNLQNLALRNIEAHMSNIITLAALDDVMGSGGETGMAAGDAYERPRLAAQRASPFSTWIKPFGNTLNQRGRGTDDGFTANTGGLEVGMDSEILPSFWLGAAFSFANARIKTKTTPRNFTHINSYQGTLYATYSPECYFVDGFLSFARNRYKNTRNIQFGTLNRTASGTFYGNQPSAKIRVGYKHRWHNLLLTPMASLQYTFLHQNQYTETGANSINLKEVSTKDTSALDGGLGITASYIVNNQKHYQLIPQVHLMYTHDFLAERQVTTASFAGGGPAFESAGTKPARGALHAGVGLTFKGQEIWDAWQLSVTYDFEKKSRLEGHTAVAQLKYLW